MMRVNWVEFFVLGLLLGHTAAVMTDRATGGDGAATAKQDVKTSLSVQDGEVRMNAILENQSHRLAGIPVGRQFIVIYKDGIDAVSAAASSLRSVFAYQQRQKKIITASGVVSPAAADPDIAVAAVLESQAKGVLGAAVIQVPASWDATTVRLAVDAPEVLAVVPDRLVTLASQGQTLATQQQTIGARRKLQQQAVAPYLAPAAAASHATADVADNSHRAVDCVGHFTSWTACSLMHAPMYRSCTKIRRFIIDTPPAKGGAACKWGDGRVQWRRCPAKACSPNPPPSPGYSPRPKHSPKPSPKPPHSPKPPRAPPSPHPKRSPVLPISPSPRPKPRRSPHPPKPPGPFPSPTPQRSPQPPNSPSPNPQPGCSRNPSRPAAAGPVPVIAVPGDVPAPWGMVRTAAFNPASRTVADVPCLMTGLNREMFVAIVDSGVDETHPDLVVAGQNDYADTVNSPYYKKDGHGHGTHVAGLIGAKWSSASGAGTVGVVPGMPVYAFKALNATGVGTISNVLRALADILRMLKQGKRIAAVNLSIAVSSHGDDPPSPEELELVCGYIEGIAEYGTASVAAAGDSNGQNVQWFYPAACPSAMAVTALGEYDFPAPFSNAALPTAPLRLLDTIMAAPGVHILSTYPMEGGALTGQHSYAIMSGTTQAAPFVAGGIALCVLSGQCMLGDRDGETHAVKDNFPVLLKAAKNNPCGSFSDVCGPSWLIGLDKAYYGYMLDVSPCRQA